MNKPISRYEYVRQWLAKAGNDLTIAKDERDLKKENAVTDAICFHCQQAAEKALKAFLVFHNVDFAKIHNLETLAAYCSKIDSDFSTLTLGRLTDYGISVRYPDDFYMPTLAETDLALRTANMIVTFVSDKIVE